MIRDWLQCSKRLLRVDVRTCGAPSMPDNEPNRQTPARPAQFPSDSQAWIFAVTRGDKGLPPFVACGCLPPLRSDSCPVSYLNTDRLPFGMGVQRRRNPHHTTLITAHEAILQQSRGAWRAAAAIAGIVSLVVTVISTFLANGLFPGAP